MLDVQCTNTIYITNLSNRHLVKHETNKEFFASSRSKVLNLLFDEVERLLGESCGTVMTRNPIMQGPLML